MEAGHRQMAFIQKRVPGTVLGTGTPWGLRRSLPARCWPSRRTAPDSWAGLSGVSTSAVPAATPCPGHSERIPWEPLNRETCFRPCQQGCHNRELSIPCGGGSQPRPGLPPAGGSRVAPKLPGFGAWFSTISHLGQGHTSSWDWPPELCPGSRRDPAPR